MALRRFLSTWELRLPRKTLVFFGACPAGIYIFKVKNRNTRTRYEICSRLKIETLEQDMKYVQGQL